MRLLLVCIILVGCLSPKAQSNSCILNSSIRLNNGGVFSSTVGAGRVEICVCSGSISDTCYWQTVSTGSTTEPMSWKNSIVVCRELGYFDVQSPILQNSVSSANQASSSVDIYPTTFVCDGTENALIDCATGTSTSALPHTADAYVSCQTASVPRKVRLTGTTLQDQGVVEYYTLGGIWRTICADSWTDTEANLVCTSLGYASGTGTLYAASGFRGTSISTVPTVQYVTCTDSTYFFSSCTVVIGVSCDSATLAGVVCVPESSQAEGSVRLFYTADPDSYERVEVYYNGRWGTVCDTVWGLEEGQVTCEELGSNPDLTEVPSDSIVFNSMSSRPIWILGYSCSGSESSLSSCTRPQYPVGYVSDTCSHSNDAGLICVNYPTDSEPGGGGLSSGAVAGIVIGSIALLFGIGWLIGWHDKLKKKRLIEAQARRRRHECTHSNQTALSTVSNTQATGSSSDYTPNVVPTPADPTLSRAPPPSYTEALKHLDVQDPPQYQDEGKTLPYPVSFNSDPAYPSAPSGTNGFQGYPSPTQSGYCPPYPGPPSSDADAGNLPYPS